jgi:hypothetical protein
MEMGSGHCAAERGYIDDVIMPHAIRQKARQFAGGGQAWGGKGA